MTTPPARATRERERPRQLSRGLVRSGWSYVRRDGLKAALVYASYRFPAARSAHRRWRRWRHGKAARGPVPPVMRPSRFPTIDPEQAAHAVAEDSYFAGLTLPTDDVTAIRCFAEVSRLRSAIGGQEIEWMLPERPAIEKREGAPLVMGTYDCRECAAIQQLSEDPLIFAVFERYFGFAATDVEARMWWSFVSDARTEERLDAEQTVLFHFDQHALNFLYFNFYLTDVDFESGPHAIVRASHRHKPLRYALSSAYKSDQAIASAYPREDIVPICGEQGFGFIEDAWCYHKALPPVRTDRLFLQLRVA